MGEAGDAKPGAASIARNATTAFRFPRPAKMLQLSQWPRAVHQRSAGTPVLGALSGYRPSRSSDFLLSCAVVPRRQCAQASTDILLPTAVGSRFASRQCAEAAPKAPPPRLAHCSGVVQRQALLPHRWIENAHRHRRGIQMRAWLSQSRGFVFRPPSVSGSVIAQVTNGWPSARHAVPGPPLSWPVR